MSKISLYKSEDDPNRILDNNLLKGISYILEEFIDEPKVLKFQNPLFDSECIPSVTLENYLIRIKRCAKCSEECFIIAIIYLERIQELNQELQFNRQNIHRFFIIAIVLAIKFHDDDIFMNEYYARVGGISLQDLNGMEKCFLNLLNFQFYVYEETYYQYLNRKKINFRK
ncbi:unnamed protein product [Paramecium primaurelia]|uniref:Cyclin n=1 Tax=Paramecium primaurelia TaxID=5886 RepID=A0A8S1LZF0_PARPR|nr:unnamed protein product [Paramecium primaurelia]